MEGWDEIAPNTSRICNCGFCSPCNSLYLINEGFEVSGSFCNCILPESIQVTAVRHLPDHPAYSGKLLLEIMSQRFIMIFTSFTKFMICIAATDEFIIGLQIVQMLGYFHYEFCQ